MITAPQLIEIAILAVMFCIAFTCHEWAHAIVAYAFGDPTGKQLGRLTLNPLAHIDPLGLLMLIVVRIGWAKPVPFDPRYFARPRLYSVLVALAGPAMNLVLATLSMALLCYTTLFIPAPVQHSYALALQVSVQINVMLAVFNLMPIPPLDGSHLLRVLVPDHLQHYYVRFTQFSFFILLALLFIPAVRLGLLNAINTVMILIGQLVCS